MADNRCREHPEPHGSMGAVFSMCDEYAPLLSMLDPRERRGRWQAKLQVGIADPGVQGRELLPEPGLCQRWLRDPGRHGQDDGVGTRDHHGLAGCAGCADAGPEFHEGTARLTRTTRLSCSFMLDHWAEEVEGARVRYVSDVFFFA